MLMPIEYLLFKIIGAKSVPNFIFFLVFELLHINKEILLATEASLNMKLTHVTCMIYRPSLRTTLYIICSVLGFGPTTWGQVKNSTCPVMLTLEHLPLCWQCRLWGNFRLRCSTCILNSRIFLVKGLTTCLALKPNHIIPLNYVFVGGRLSLLYFRDINPACIFWTLDWSSNRLPLPVFPCEHWSQVQHHCPAEGLFQYSLFHAKMAFLCLWSQQFTLVPGPSTTVTFCTSPLVFCSISNS